jgi:protein-S-isoprenylcysteine O-methyltransferase Ste14
MILQITLFIVAFLLFYLGAKNYSFSRFTGIYQVKTGNTGNKLTAKKELNKSGILKYIRHPWYTGALLIIWARDIYLSVIIENVIITLYMIIGTYWEEQKLVHEFGESYREYKKQVSMFIPVKWLARKII